MHIYMYNMSCRNQDLSHLLLYWNRQFCRYIHCIYMYLLCIVDYMYMYVRQDQASWLDIRFGQMYNYMYMYIYRKVWLVHVSTHAY